MEKTGLTFSGRSQLMVAPPSPQLVRSRSGSNPAAITTPDRSSRRFSTSERSINGNRSKSTLKERTQNNEGNINSQEKKSRDGFGKFLQRGVSPDINGASKRVTSTMKLPSAWALSPGRGSLGSPIGSKSPVKANRGSGGGGVAKVLKYFKQKKVSSIQEEEYHRFKILHNRLMQWRFINARAEVAMANVENIAEIQTFSVWLTILMLRKIIIQRRIQMQKVKHMIKLYHIMNRQLSLLSEWAKLERRNQESIGKLTRKLSAVSATLPLSHGLKPLDPVLEEVNQPQNQPENEIDYDHVHVSEDVSDTASTPAPGDRVAALALNNPPQHLGDTAASRVA
ncbi:QWRF motif-containing protein 7 [Gastrolobium bilobum]|uniref:QWRF motif-containing protein 7 n=1 Tax=Gastrolobium bilobum TaxID=150636 RepID=UPI002AAF0B09|nr:QWRF motif-containing protein 7 [Gastrolobium bilobum]